MLRETKGSANGATLGASPTSSLDRVGGTRSLSTRLVLSLVLLFVVFGSVTLGVLVHLELWRQRAELTQLKQLIYSTLDGKSVQLTHAHAAAIGILATDNSFSDIQRLVSHTVAEDEDVIYGAFVRVSGTTIAFSAPGNIDGRASRDAAREVLGLSPTELSATRFGRHERIRFAKSVVEYSVPVWVGDEVYGNLFYGVSTQKVEDAVAHATRENGRILRRILVQVSLGVLAVTLLGAGLAWHRARQLTKPIVELTRAAQRLSTGQRDVQVEIRSGDEIETLGAAFNTMVRDLERSYAELESSNQHLQLEIQERRRAETERELAQQKLFRAQKLEAIGQLAGGVAHDFNNLLAVIQGNIDLLVGTQSTTDTREMLADITAAVTHGASLTRQLLTFSRKQPNQPTHIEPFGVVENVQKLIRRLLSEQYELRVLLETTPMTLLMDPGRLEQVLLNLTLNARDAMTGFGQILVTAKRREVVSPVAATTGIVPVGTYFELVVQDQGCGMSPEVIEHIFEPFFTTKELGKGTGLGLATVHGIVSEAKGFVDVVSDLGQGSTFAVILPVFQEDTEQCSSPRLPSTMPEGTGKTIVLCEDEATVRDVVSRILASRGYRVRAFDRPSRALNFFGEAASMPHLLITDVVMPEQNGQELAALARQRFPELKVLFISGYTAGILKDVGVDDVDDCLLKKPFGAQELLEKVAVLVE